MAIISRLVPVAFGVIFALSGAEGITRELVFLFCGPLALAWFFNGVIFAARVLRKTEAGTQKATEAPHPYARQSRQIGLFNLRR